MKKSYNALNATAYSFTEATLDFNSLNTYYRKIKKYYSSLRLTLCRKGRMGLKGNEKWEWKIIN